MFVRPNGAQLHPQQINRALTKLVTHLGLPHITPHGLRHMSVSLGAAAGETLLEASRRIGHASTSTTGDLYGHVFDEQAKIKAEARAELARSRLRSVS